MEFSWNPTTKCTEKLNLIFQRTLFLIFLLFQKYLSPHVRSNKMVNSVPQDQHQRYILSYFFKLFSQGFISVQNACSIFYYFYFLYFLHHVQENFFNLWYSHSQKIHRFYAILIMPHFPTQKRQVEFFGNLFPPRQKGQRKI